MTDNGNWKTALDYLKETMKKRKRNPLGSYGDGEIISMLRDDSPKVKEVGKLDVFAEEMQDCEAKEDVCQVSDTFHLLEECVQRTTQRSSDKKFRCIVEVANQYEIRHTYCTPLASKEFYFEGARKEAMDDKECLIKHVKDDIDVLSVTKILLLKADWLRKMEPEHFKDIAAHLLQRMSETVVTMVYQYAAPQNSKLQEVSSLQYKADFGERVFR